jgi:hypothetical protein
LEALKGGKDGCEKACDSESKRMEVAIDGSVLVLVVFFLPELIMSCTTIYCACSS